MFATELSTNRMSSVERVKRGTSNKHCHQSTVVEQSNNIPNDLSKRVHSSPTVMPFHTSTVPKTVTCPAAFIRFFSAYFFALISCVPSFFPCSAIDVQIVYFGSVRRKCGCRMCRWHGRHGRMATVESCLFVADKIAVDLQKNNNDMFGGSNGNSEITGRSMQ